MTCRRRVEWRCSEPTNQCLGDLLTRRTVRGTIVVGAPNPACLECAKAVWKRELVYLEHRVFVHSGEVAGCREMILDWSFSEGCGKPGFLQGLY